MKKWILVLSLTIATLSILDRTYYDALQIPVSASADQIRDAFRTQSKKYHPDRNPDSKQKFQTINNAYETLFNVQRKFRYDRVGRQKMDDQNFLQGVNLHEMKGPQLKIKLLVDLKDFYTGKELTVTVEKQVACPHCKGTGAENPYDIVTCKECGGKGQTTRRVQLGGGYYNLYTQACSRCGGKGKVIGRKCHLCKEVKIIPGIQDFTLNIKPGTPSGSELLYQNMGDEKLIGAPSDIVFQLVEIPHSTLKRKFEHIETQIFITLQEAIFGFKKTITHLDGREIQVSQTRITQPGEIQVIEGEGMPILNSESKGNLYVKIGVIIPSFSESQIEKLKEVFQNKVVDQ